MNKTAHNFKNVYGKLKTQKGIIENDHPEIEIIIGGNLADNSKHSEKSKESF